MEDIHPNTEETLKHYGYDSDSAAPAMGLWPNDGTMIAKLQKVLESCKQKSSPKTRKF